jgi:aerobic-type carbon monoxide dehydrogenase small subunit (CoxS/CutS family)
MSVFNFRVNGQVHRVDADADTPLLYVLSDDSPSCPNVVCVPGQCGSVHRDSSKAKRCDPAYSDQHCCQF